MEGTQRSSNTFAASNRKSQYHSQGSDMRKLKPNFPLSPGVLIQALNSQFRIPRLSWITRQCIYKNSPSSACWEIVFSDNRP